MKVERLHEDALVSVLRIHGRPREPVEGRHKRLVVYAAPMSQGEVVRHLLDAADALERQLPRTPSP